jgi:hypothetical protein
MQMERLARYIRRFRHRGVWAALALLAVLQADALRAWEVRQANAQVESQPSGNSTAAHPAPQKVIFARDVLPIFQRRCFGCHSGDVSKGGLRLDDRKLAQRGGESGQSLLVSDLQNNELLRRVTSDELGHRMPLEGDPLADNEIRTLRAWIAQGADWPVTEAPPPSSRANPGPGQLFTEKCERVAARIGWITIYAALTVCILILIVRIWRRRIAARETSTPTKGWLTALVWRLGPLVQSWAFLLVVVWGAVNYGLSLQRDLNELHREARSRPYQSADSNSGPARPAGPQPYIPPRPEKTIHAVYYRGNDERSPQLFNGGFYCTAVFRLDLCGADRKVLEIGDEVVGQPLYVRLVIERAPHATPSLFTAAVMGDVLLTPVVPETKMPGLEAAALKLETVREGEEWSVYYPIESPASPQQKSASGVFYLSKGTVKDDALHGSLWHQAAYDLVFEDGRLAEGSNLTFGSLYKFGTLQPLEPGKIQQSEWLDYRQIPFIVGENSSDPKLLGVPEHAP